MYVMIAKVTFPRLQNQYGNPLVVRRVTEVHIESSYKETTQFAELKMPRASKLLGGKRVRDLFKIGDEVVVELGYDAEENLVEEFRGYITKIGSDVPIYLRVEDEMWKAKKLKVNYVGKGVMLQELLKAIAPGYEIDALEVKLGSVRFSQTTLGECLEKLKSEWNLYSYFVGKKLVCGKYYAEQGGEVKYFSLEKNVAQNDLNYRNPEDILLKINAKSINANGSKIEVSQGEDGGDQMNLAYYNVGTKAELEQKVKEDYERATRGGLDGDFTAFGIPRVSFGDKASISSSMYPDRNGEYYIQSVVKDFSPSGYRQKITIDGQSKLTGSGQ